MSVPQGAGYNDLSCTLRETPGEFLDPNFQPEQPSPPVFPRLVGPSLDRLVVMVKARVNVECSFRRVRPK